MRVRVGDPVGDFMGGLSARAAGEMTETPKFGASSHLIQVARGGIEPPTYRFSGGRSYQLSYLAVRPATS